MSVERTRRRAGWAATLALALVGGICVGVLVVAPELTQRVLAAQAEPAALFVDHAAPLLAEPNETVTIDITALCEWNLVNEAGADMYDTCDPDVRLYTRTIGKRNWKEVRPSGDNPFLTTAEVRIAKEGIEYYIHVVDRESGVEKSLPEAGPYAPNRIYAMPSDTTDVQVPAHQFGNPHSGDLIAEVGFGSEPGQAGITDPAPGGDAMLIGPQAIAIDDASHVMLLDSINGRVLDISRVGNPIVATVPPASSDLGWTTGGLVVMGTRGTTTFVGAATQSGFTTWDEFDSGADSVGLLASSTGSVGLMIDGRTRGFAPVDRNGVGAIAGAGATLELSSELGTTRGNPAALSADELASAETQERTDRLPTVAAGNITYQVRDDTILVAVVRGNRVVQGWRIVSPTQWGSTPRVISDGSSLALVSYITDGVTTEGRVLQLTDDEVTADFGVPVQSYADHDYRGSVKFDSGRLYILTSTERAAYVHSYDLNGGGA